jgi:hypothetical protein
MIIYEIKLPKGQNPKVFTEFMQKEYFPGIYTGQTRVGQVIDLLLLQGMRETTGSDTDHHFLWQVGWSGLDGGNAHTNDADLQKKFESFHADVKRIGMFEEVATSTEKEKL